MATPVKVPLTSGPGMTLTSVLPHFCLRSLSFFEQADVQLMPSILKKRGKGSSRMEKVFVPTQRVRCQDEGWNTREWMRGPCGWGYSASSRLLSFFLRSS